MGTWRSSSRYWWVGWEGPGIGKRRLAMYWIDELGCQGWGQECGMSSIMMVQDNADLAGGMEGAK
jgi:hypothetical protein